MTTRDLAFLFAGAYIGFLASAWRTLGTSTYLAICRLISSGKPSKN